LKHLNNGAPDDDNVYFFTDTSNLHPAVLQRTPEGTWSIIDKVPITEGLDTRTFRDVPVWNGDVNPEVTAYRFQGEWVRVPSVIDAAEIDLTGENAHHIVAHLSSNTLTETENSVVESHRNYLMFFEFADGALNRMDIPIDGYDGNTNRNFIDVIDVDGDGLDDVVSYDYIYDEDDPLFNVYRNTGENRFEKINLDSILPEPLETTGSSLVRDFNDDGHLDILEWASNAGVDDPDSPSAVIHFATENWLSDDGESNTGASAEYRALYRPVQEAYVAYYDRAADPGGLEYWASVLVASGADMAEILSAFANSPEARQRYGEINSQTIDNIVEQVYQGLFDREPDAGGLEFYTRGFEAGHFTPRALAVDILHGAQGEDAIKLDNRISMSMVESLTHHGL
jgi:hypothetical protein